MFPVWDFVVGIFARKTMIDMGCVLSIISIYIVNRKYVAEMRLGDVLRFLTLENMLLSK